MSEVLTSPFWYPLNDLKGESIVPNHNIGFLQVVQKDI